MAKLNFVVNAWAVLEEPIAPYLKYNLAILDTPIVKL